MLLHVLDLDQKLFLWGSSTFVPIVLLAGVDPWSFYPHRPGEELAELISFPCLVNNRRYHRVFWLEAPPSTVCTRTGVFRNSYKAEIQPHRPRHHRTAHCL